MQTNELHLRPETEEDADFLKTLFRSTRNDLLQLGLPPALLDNMMEMQFRAQRSNYFAQYPVARNSIVEKDGSPIGLLLKYDAKAELRLVNIALLPEERGKGYGRRLVAALQREAVLANKPLTLSVNPHNGPANRLYLSLGFTVEKDDGANLELIWRADTLSPDIS